jgi:crotonobetainyl-CoA:carnitine CoA-transferase CaiB-like acyl-CoA transferase
MGNSVSRLNTFLRGIHVVDLSRNRPGPLATLLLADLGASILKIEPPQGDSSRFRGVDATTGRSAYYDALNAGKSIRCADLKNPVQRERVLAEIEQADVLVESYRYAIPRPRCSQSSRSSGPCAPATVMARVRFSTSL